MKHICIACLALCLACVSCITEDNIQDTPEDNFEALWQIIDRHYCFLDYKQQQYGLDWNEVHSRYRKRLSADMSSRELFQVLAEMLAELRDGHVNLVSAGETSYYRKWFDAYPTNFSDSIQRIYLGKDYVSSSILKYRILSDNLAYAYFGSFANGIGEGSLDEFFDRIAICDGLILDIRQNGGGMLTTSEALAARFTNHDVLTGYMQHKTGPGHNDFSEPIAIYTKPHMDRVRWQKPVAILTNRSTFSAANDFVNRMRQMPQAVIIGDYTGGGSGLPFSSELPNGWSVRFSASPIFSPQMEQTEFGIAPDIKVDMAADDLANSRDAIIEKAREYLHKKLVEQK